MIRMIVLVALALALVCPAAMAGPGQGTVVIEKGNTSLQQHAGVAAGVGQFYAAALTDLRGCSFSKRLERRYPRFESRRLSL